MATLVLTMAGGAIGGPIGAAIGATLGSAVDRELLFKQKRAGPRLTELAVQTSSYGTPLPKLFGTIRVAGCVIWASDLVEHRGSSGGKGQPATTTYSYTASFAVALSARPIRAVHRIWADGKLLRGAAGDFKARTGFRLHAGGEDQPLDPLIAAAEGASLAPAHRGLAYAVFEDLELGDFGNRIPSLTFEVEADAGPCGLGMVAAEISGGDVVGEESLLSIDGLSAYGTSVRATVEPLAEAAGAWCVAEAGRLRLAAGLGATVPVRDAGAGADGARRQRAFASAESAPKSLAIAHYDAARDYQAGLQRATRPGPGTREQRIELPAVLEAGAAKTLAEGALARADLGRERRRLMLDWRGMRLKPGDRVTIEGEAGQWRIQDWSLEAMALALDCVRIAPAPVPATASPGRVADAPDLIIGETLAAAAELPMLDDTLAAVPRLAILAGGSGPGWRGAALLLSTDAGAQWKPIGRSGAPAVIGTVAVPPGYAPATLADRRNGIEVELAHAGMILTGADRAALDAGTNLALAGEELLQFAAAEPLGGARWRLSGLWRGRRGTEAGIGTQVPGDRFVLIAADALTGVDLPSAAIGGEAWVLASGVGDSEPSEVRAPLTGASVVPPSPVRLRASERPDGTTILSWTRRSRAGWGWIDGGDVPLAEERERYRVTVASAEGRERSIETDLPETVLPASDRATALTIEVRQLGTNGASPPATLMLAAL